MLQSGQFNEDMIPTVGFNMRKITKGNVTIKVIGIELSVFSILYRYILYIYVNGNRYYCAGTIVLVAVVVDICADLCMTLSR